ncbi:MAG: GatB/YqeY domain-containing protein, partial [Actinomycetota bacterium]
RQNGAMSNESGLKARIQADISDAVRAGDELTKSTLRMALAAIMNAEVAGSEAVVLSDEQIINVLRSESKKRAESAEIYEQAGRTESAAKERGEIEIIERYLPAAMDADALSAIVAEEVAKAASNGQAGPKAMGAVIKAVKERVGAAADGAAIAAAVKSALA